MCELIQSLLYSLSFGLRTRTRLRLELLALRHQLVAQQRKVPARPKLTLAHLWLWVVLSRPWSAWRSSLVIVKAETVVSWHRKGLRLYWTWKGRPQLGRPKINAELREIQEKSWAIPAQGRLLSGFYFELWAPSTPVRKK